MTEIIDNIDNSNTTHYTMLDIDRNTGGQSHFENGMQQACIGFSLLLEGVSTMARLRQHVTLPNGEKIWVTGNTVSDMFSNFIARMGYIGTAPPANSNVVLRDFVEETYSPQFMNELAPTTISNYKVYLNLYILPFLGNKPMGSITTGNVQEFLNWMANAKEHGRRKNLNKRTIERVKGFSSRIFEVAKDMGIVTRNPFRSKLLRINAENAKHHTALPDDETDRVKRELPALKDDIARLIISIAIYTGMRREEVLGLRWENVNLEKGYCEVRCTVTYPDNNKPVVRERAKTESSIRTVILPKALVSILLPHRQESGYVIGGDSPLCYSTLARHEREGRNKLGIPTYSLHDFRATYGTQLKENGLTSAQIADLLGHADTRMVETVYARTRTESILKRREDVERLSAAYTEC